MLNIITYLWKLLNVICATRCFRHCHTGTIIKTANIDTPNFSNLISLVIDSVQTVYSLYSWQALICDNQNTTCGDNLRVCSSIVMVGLFTLL